MTSDRKQPDLIMIGPQGSGKGTQTERLVERFGYVPVATGHMLRDHVAAKDDLGMRVRDYLQRGKLVPDDIIEEVVRTKLETITPDQPIVYDGFPRTLKQAQMLEAIYLDIGREAPWAIYLRIPRSVVIERLAHRFVCTECGKILQFVPPFIEGQSCPECAGAVQARTDDRPEIIETRLNLFFEMTLPVIHHYQHRGRLWEIDASGTIDHVSRVIEQQLAPPLES